MSITQHYYTNVNVYIFIHLIVLYSVDERLGVCQLVDLCKSHTIKAFDAQHDPVTGCGKLQITILGTTVLLVFPYFSQDKVLI